MAEGVGARIVQWMNGNPNNMQIYVVAHTIVALIIIHIGRYLCNKIKTKEFAKIENMEIAQRMVSFMCLTGYASLSVPFFYMGYLIIASIKSGVI